MLQTDVIQKAGIAETDIRQLQTLWDAWQNAQKRPVRKKPHIVCTGIYNAGKSTLLNALVGEEKSPTGNIPTTKKIAQAEFGGAVYIDTPGLNATAEDDQETRAAYESADFILFVANAQDGGISEAEAAWLKKLRDRYTADSLKQRLIFVLTQCGQTDGEQLPAIQKKFREDLKKALGFAAEQVFCVDSVTYQDGKKENQQLLIEHGAVDELRKYLDGKIKTADKLLVQVRETELATRKKDVLAQIQKVQTTLQEIVEKGNGKKQEQVAAIDQAWEEFESKLQAAMPVWEINNEFSSLAVEISTPSTSEIKSKSESDVRQRIRNRLSSSYDRIERNFRRLVQDSCRHGHSPIRPGGGRCGRSPSKFPSGRRRNSYTGF